MFSRSYDGVTNTDSTFAATLSAFRLDTYEIVVGRFRAFADAYPGSLPVGGAGKNPKNATDPGWDATWNAAMPPTRAALTTALKCSATYQTWTDTPGANENRAMNCLDWYMTFAFCIWDGGRLPTEAEWNYAASGGGGADGQRVYPWSSPSMSTTIDVSFANYGAVGSVAIVGSRSPKGDGRWGHADLAGNTWEWVLDWHASPYTITPCNDCASFTASGTRVIRGGSFFGAVGEQTASKRLDVAPNTPDFTNGGRCARSP